MLEQDQPAEEVVTYCEFIFLGGTKLVHVLRENDVYEDRGDHHYLAWTDVSEDALLYKRDLLQFGRRISVEKKADQTAVQKVVAEIKQKEARAQGAVGRVQAAQAPLTPKPTAAAAVPLDLQARSPIKR